MQVDKTPLHLAAQQGHFEISQMLVRCGATVNATDMVSWSLHYYISILYYILYYNVYYILYYYPFDHTFSALFDNSCCMISCSHDAIKIKTWAYSLRNLLAFLKTEQRVLKEWFNWINLDINVIKFSQLNWVKFNVHSRMVT